MKWMPRGAKSAMKPYNGRFHEPEQSAIRVSDRTFVDWQSLGAA